METTYATRHHNMYFYGLDDFMIVRLLLGFAVFGYGVGLGVGLDQEFAFRGQRATRNGQAHGHELGIAFLQAV